MTRTGI